MLYKLKIAAKRGSALLGAVGLLAGVGTSAIPAFTPVASADALNPLTKRSLTLSSSSPGWAYTDGSGNSTYAPPNSGANGKQTGNVFAFHNSTANGHVKTMSFQYCTGPAGDCVSPGNDAETAGTGTISLTAGDTAVTGLGTQFLTEMPAGTEFTTAGGYSYTVAGTPSNDTSLTISPTLGSANAPGANNGGAEVAESGVTFTYRGGDSVTNGTSDLNVVANSPAEVSGTTTPLTGTITVNSGDTDVTSPDSSTLFTSELAVGDSFITAGGHSYVVAAINSDSDLTITTAAAATETSVTYSKSDFATVVDTQDGSVKAVPGVTDPLTSAGHPITTGQYAAHAVAGNFLVEYDSGSGWVQSTGWTMSVANVENSTIFPPTATENLTGKDNYIVLTNSSGDLNVPFDTPIKVLFFGTTNNYITNPGAGAFFVKINTYSNSYDGSTSGHDLASLEPATDANVIDGGVTVANVMNQSIQIQTKVLETMEFSVGTVDPDTLSSTDHAGGPSSLEMAEGVADAGGTHALKHGSCDNIVTRLDGESGSTDPQDVLMLGNQAQESSLSTDHTYSTHSYWRLSSNSSAGATVYYSGHTLSDTEGDEIAPINGGNGTKTQAIHGSAQFGLALDNGGTLGFGDTANAVDYGQEATYENAADNTVGNALSGTTGHLGDNSANASYHDPQLYPLVPDTNYADGTGGIETAPLGTQFAFDVNSDTIPAAVASESTQVVDCVTGKARYMANIAATTPAGIYTTKINWIAAPQY